LPLIRNIFGAFAVAGGGFESDAARGMPD